jgi:hypothetical protein
MTGMTSTAYRFLSRPCALLLALVGAAVMLLPAPSASAATRDLFVLTSAGGSLERVPGERREFKLVLRRPARDVTAFSDRPTRRAAARPLSRFVRRWRRLGFAGVPPNAALVIDRAPIGRDVAVFELSRPRLGRGARTLTFDARALARRPAGGLLRLGRRADDPAAGRFGRASLFIDPAGDTQRLAATFSFTDLPPSAGRGVAFAPNGPSFVGLFDVRTDGAAHTFRVDSAFAVTSNSGTPLDATVRVSLNLPAGMTSLTGTATGAGGSATVTVGNGEQQPLPPGPFSIPIK